MRGVLAAFAVFGIGAFGVLGGCGSSGSSAGEVDEQARALEMLATAHAEAQCDQFVEWCREGGAEAADTDGCVDARARQVRGEIEEILRDHVRFDVSEAEQCARELRAWEPGQEPDRAATSCRYVLVGTREIGETCSDTRECGGRRAAPAYCGDGVCRASLPPGAECSTAAECEGYPSAQCPRARDDLRYCVSYSVAGEGEACGSTCLRTGNCPAELRRDPTLGVGGICRSVDGLYCGPEGKCVRGGPVGEACAHAGACGADAWCDGGICSPLRGEGALCEAGGCETGLDCWRGGYGEDGLVEPLTCRARLPTGASCGSGEPRCEGICNGATGTCESLFEPECSEGLVRSLDGRFGSAMSGIGPF